MVILHTKSAGGFAQRFLAPDAGDGSGVGSTVGAAKNGAGGKEEGVKDIDPKLFDTLPWNELDDESRATLNRIKELSVATLQQKQHLEKEFKRVDGLARNFQSEADRLKADAKKKTTSGGEGGGNRKVEDDPYLSAVAEELAGAGFGDEESKKLAPVFAGMFKKIGTIEREKLGKDLTPMASQMLAQQAHNAFMSATQQDELGMFQAPEVQQAVWDLVRERVEKGVDTTPEIVLNLAKMAYADKLLLDKKGGGGEGGGGAGGGGGGGEGGGQRQQTGILPANPPTMNTGGFNFGPGGGGITPLAHRSVDPNAPKHALNEDTRNALASSFRSMLAGTNIVPTELAGALKSTKRGGR